MLKLNGNTAIILSILGFVAGFGGLWAVSQKRINDLEIRFEKVEKHLEHIDDSHVTKEILNLNLLSIKQDLEYNKESAIEIRESVKRIENIQYEMYIKIKSVYTNVPPPIGAHTGD